MLYAKIIDEEVSIFPYSLKQLRADNPNVSFAASLDKDTLESFGCFEVTPKTTPTESKLTHNILRGTNPTLEGDVWRVDYYAEPKSQDQASQNVRAERDRLLRLTDWTALSDVTMSAEMTSYRQALRDITAQEGFPYSVVWPTKP